MRMESENRLKGPSMLRKKEQNDSKLLRSIDTAIKTFIDFSINPYCHLNFEKCSKRTRHHVYAFPIFFPTPPLIHVIEGIIVLGNVGSNASSRYGGDLHRKPSGHYPHRSRTLSPGRRRPPAACGLRLTRERRRMPYFCEIECHESPSATIWKRYCLAGLRFLEHR